MSEKDITNTITALFNKATTSHQDGQLEDAITYYKDLLVYLPDEPLIHYNMAHAFYDIKMYQQSLAHYAIAAKDNQTDKDILFNYALCLKKCNELQNAIKVLQQLLDLDKNDIEVNYTLANTSKDADDYENAICYYLRTLNINPDHKSGLTNLAFTYHKTGQLDKARECYEKLIQLSPDNVNAKYMLDALSGEKVKSAPEKYVTELFNNYSANYEHSLIKQLQYCVPQKLRTFFDSLNLIRQFNNGLDLGCGSGLGAESFVDICQNFIGVDLSHEMVQLASNKQLYSALFVEDIDGYLNNTKDTFDLILAADVFTYIGELESIFSKTISSASSTCYFIFSTENSEQEYSLKNTGRFGHSKRYITKTANQTGWNVLKSEPVNLRMEKGVWITGKMYILVNKANC